MFNTKIFKKKLYLLLYYNMIGRHFKYAWVYFKF